MTGDPNPAPAHPEIRTCRLIVTEEAGSPRIVGEVVNGAAEVQVGLPERSAHDLGARALKARRDELEGIVANGFDARRKAAPQAFVHRVVVIEPGVIQAAYLTRGGLPTDMVDERDHTASSRRLAP